MDTVSFSNKLFALRRLLVIILLFNGFMITRSMQAQEIVSAADSSHLIIHRLETGKNPGKVTLNQDPRLTQILRRHFEYNKTAGGPGWRLLIYKGKGRNEAFNAQAAFLEYFNNLNLKVDIYYEEPDFITLVGSFRTREEAFRFKQILNTRFPASYPVPATIYID